MTIQFRELHERLSNVERCAEEAPSGTYQLAKDYNAFNDRLFRFVRAELAEFGLAIPNNDRWRDVEAVIFGAVDSVNPLAFATSEGFGDAMDGPAAERVKRQAADNLSFLRSIGAVQE